MQMWLSKQQGIMLAIGNCSKIGDLKKIGKHETLKQSFSLAYTNNKYDSKPVYINCAAWGKLAEYAATLEKGCRVIIIGELVSSQYTNRNGEQKTWNEIKVEWMNIIRGDIDYLPEGFEPPDPTLREKDKPKEAKVEEYADVSEDDDDLPF